MESLRGRCERFRERLEQVLADTPGVEDWVLLDFEGVGAVDATGLDVLAQVAPHLSAAGVDVVAVARANDRVLATLDKARLLQPAGLLRVFPTINSAVAAYRRRRP